MPASRFNEMIDYYTHELKVRLKEIKELREQHQLLIKASIKQQDRAVDASERTKEIQKENVFMRKKLGK